MSLLISIQIDLPLRTRWSRDRTRRHAPLASGNPLVISPERVRKTYRLAGVRGWGAASAAVAQAVSFMVQLDRLVEEKP